jgi:hypothetical protein
MKDLLKVLDMSEDEQLFFLHNLWQNRQLPQYYGFHPIDDKFPMSDWNRQLLADLAFRLRDEAIEKDLDWDDTLILVWEKLGRPMKYQAFCKYYAKPIHWIIAALIAKDKENE